MIIENNTQAEASMLHDNIQVCVRVRPMNQQEKAEGNRQIIDQKDNCLILQKNSKDQKMFTYDSVYNVDSTQEDIFKNTGQTLIENFLNGYNCSIFAYGQTGAGKTYTMMGDLNEEKQTGLQPRCIDYLFYLLNEKKTEETLIKITFIEIYNEKIIDLLSEDLRQLNLREDLKKGVFLENVTEEIVSHQMEVLEILKKGLKNRHVSETMMNNQSSRSHSIFTIYFQTCSEQNEYASYTSSRFNFVDLAGSERQRLTLSTGDRFKEGCQINKSLTVLGSVINTLAESSKTDKKRHIRYRDSKLTFLLKNSLGGNSKTAFIANVSPASSYFVETLSTLLFAQRAKMIKNEAKINENVKSNSLHVLKIELLKTKDELNYMKEKYNLLEKNQLQFGGTLDNGNCSNCMHLQKKMDTKLLERNNILKESLIILRKSMITWEMQITNGKQTDKDFCEVKELLKGNSEQIKQLVLLLGIDTAQRENDISTESLKETNQMKLCEAKIKYYQEQNTKLEVDLNRMFGEFEVVENILKKYFSEKNENYQQIKNTSQNKETDTMILGVEILDKEQKLKIERLTLDLEKSKTELRYLRDSEGKLKNEISVLIERNKMLKSWNEQTLQDKKLLNETIEKIRYEKFNLMRKFDDEFEQTKSKNERLLEDIENLENEKNILQEGINNISEELKIFQSKNLDIEKQLENKVIAFSTLEQENLKLQDCFEVQKIQLEEIITDFESVKQAKLEVDDKFHNLQCRYEEDQQRYEIKVDDLKKKNLFLENLKIEQENQIDKFTKENEVLKISNEDILSKRNETAQNLKKILDKQETTEKSRENLFKTVEALKIQNKQFFTILLNIKNKLGAENSVIFDDFINVAQIYEQNQTLEKNLSEEKIKNQNLEKSLKQLISQCYQKSRSVKKIFEKIMFKQQSVNEALIQKNKTIQFYQQNLKHFQNKSLNINIKNPSEEMKFEDVIFLDKKNILEKDKENLIDQGFKSQIKTVSFQDQNQELGSVSKKIKFEQQINSSLLKTHMSIK